MSSRKKSTSSNTSDKEMEYLEKEFLNCDVNDIPVPKTDEIGDYEREVLEVMKTGCNRQIAEYVIIEYKKQEDNDKKDDNKFETLSELRENYYKKIENIISSAKKDLNNYKNEKNDKDFKDVKQEMEGYEEEIEEILKDVLDEKNEEKDEEDLRKHAYYYLYKHLFSEDKKPPKDTEEMKKKYTDKKDAVIEAALRKIKKIVNDEEEYKKFYKGYYKKDLEKEGK